MVISKLNVIGERQRFGLRVLEAGFNVLFADLDAIFLRSPAHILADGDLIGERIWGRPLSVVKKWGAAICTGFYFVRSTPQTIKIFRRTHFMIATKRQRMPKWQASSTCRVAHNWHQSYGPLIAFLLRYKSFIALVVQMGHLSNGHHIRVFVQMRSTSE